MRAIRLAARVSAPMPKLPLAEAATVLGVSTSALRRRLRAGTLAGEKEPTPPYRWLVEVSGEALARLDDDAGAAGPAVGAAAPRAALYR